MPDVSIAYVEIVGIQLPVAQTLPATGTGVVIFAKAVCPHGLAWHSPRHVRIIPAGFRRVLDNDEEMPEFKDKIPAAGGKVEYLYDPQRGIAPQISGTGFRAIYQVALSIDGKHLLATVPAGGIGSMSIYPQPSVFAFVQSDQQGMWDEIALSVKNTSVPIRSSEIRHVPTAQRSRQT